MHDGIFTASRSTGVRLANGSVLGVEGWSAIVLSS